MRENQYKVVEKQKLPSIGFRYKCIDAKGKDYTMYSTIEYNKNQIFQRKQ